MRRFFLTLGTIDILCLVYLIFAQIESYLVFVNDRLQNLDSILFGRNFNKLNIKYQSYPKSRKIIDKFE